MLVIFGKYRDIYWRLMNSLKSGFDLTAKITAEEEIYYNTIWFY